MALNQFMTDYAGQPVIYFWHNINNYAKDTLIQERYGRVLAAYTPTGNNPVEMADSGQQATNGFTDTTSQYNEYKSMVDAELARAPKADLTAQYVRTGAQGTGLHFTVTITNHSNVTLLNTSNDATIYATVYEDFTSNPSDLAYSNVFKNYHPVQAMASVKITRPLAQEATDVYTLDIAPFTYKYWDHLRMVVFADYRTGGTTGKYDVLQAYAIDPVKDQSLIYTVNPNTISALVDVNTPGDKQTKVTVTSLSPSLTWTVSNSNVSWMTISPLSGKAGESFTVSVIAGALAPGSQNTTITMQLKDVALSADPNLSLNQIIPVSATLTQLQYFYLPLVRR